VVCEPWTRLERLKTMDSDQEAPQEPQTSGSRPKAPQGPQASDSRPKLGRADLIGIFGVTIALIALVGPWISHRIESYQQSRVLITSPLYRQDMPDNAFGASGIATHIPSDDDLWLVVQSDEYYPYDALKVTDGRWNVPAYKICTSSGSNFIEIYLISDTADGTLFNYRDSGSKQHLTGISSLPPGARLMAYTRVNVSDSILC
jgi:hypothetical protein